MHSVVNVLCWVKTHWDLCALCRFYYGVISEALQTTLLTVKKKFCCLWYSRGLYGLFSLAILPVSLMVDVKLCSVPLKFQYWGPEICREKLKTYRMKSYRTKPKFWHCTQGFEQSTHIDYALILSNIGRIYTKIVVNKICMIHLNTPLPFFFFFFFCFCQFSACQTQGNTEGVYSQSWRPPPLPSLWAQTQIISVPTV